METQNYKSRPMTNEQRHMTNHYEQTKNKLRKEPKCWLITGVAGFIVSNLLEHLLRLDQTVTGLDNFSTGHEKNLAEVKSLVCENQWARFRFVKGDIRDIGACQEACKDTNLILHEAAIGSVHRSVRDPIFTNENNITGTLNMLVAARDQKVKRMVYAASSSTYGDHPGLPKVEDRIGKPLSPYAVTKYVNELYADVFARCYGLETIGLRYFNVFGPRQDPKGAYAAVIPRWIEELLSGKVPTIHGDGETSRDFCFIDNVVQANIIAATTINNVATNQVYNVAVGDKTTLNDLFNMIKEFIGEYDSKAESIEPMYGSFRSGDVRHSQADIFKIKDLLGFNPSHTVINGMKETVEWFVKRISNVNAGQNKE